MFLFAGQNYSDLSKNAHTQKICLPVRIDVYINK